MSKTSLCQYCGGLDNLPDRVVEKEAFASGHLVCECPQDWDGPVPHPLLNHFKNCECSIYETLTFHRSFEEIRNLELIYVPIIGEQGFKEAVFGALDVMAEDAVEAHLNPELFTDIV